MSQLEQKLRDRTAKLGVIGLGYVGLPLAVEKAKAGFKVIGFDVQMSKVDLVNNGTNYIGDVVDADLAKIVADGMLTATSEFASLRDTDCVCICVPTPLDKHQQPDISYVQKTAETLKEFIHQDMLIILESTTYPGTTEELLKPILEKSGLKCGVDFNLAFSPERVDPGNRFFKTKNTPKVVGGITPECTRLAAMLYEIILEAPVMRVSSPAVAEMEKILENTYRNINIGLVNEMAMLCERMEISIWEVIDAAKTKPYGFQAFYPGPGLGGHCIPLDPYYLTWKAREYGFHTSMIEASSIINDKMPEYCTDRVTRLLNTVKKSVNGAKILMLGIAYKRDIDDFRESPALKIIDLLEALGAEVSFYDSYIAKFRENGIERQGLPSLTPDLVAEADLVLITTDHSNVDYEMVSQQAKLIFDTKNAMKDIHDRGNISLL